MELAERKQAIRPVLTWVFAIGTLIPLTNIIITVLLRICPQVKDWARTNFFDGEGFYFVLLLIPTLVGIIACMRYAKRGELGEPDRVKASLADMRVWGLLFAIELISYLVQITVVAVNSSLEMTFDIPTPISAPSADMSIYALVTTAIIGPIGEELICRQLMYKLLRPYGAGITILVSSMIFALAHPTLLQVFTILISGIGFGLLREKYGLYMSIWWHIVLNTFVCAIQLSVYNAYVLFLFYLIAMGVIIPYLLKNFLFCKGFVYKALKTVGIYARDVITTPMLWVMVLTCIMNLALDYV